MADVSISEAARLTGKGRATIQRHIKNGKLSVGKDAAGNPVIDTSELVRVYGVIQVTDTPPTESTSQLEAVTIQLLQEQLRAAHEREEWLKGQLEAEQERSRELERRMLPPGEERKGFFSRLFGR
jgi:hypothetical protein